MKKIISWITVILVVLFFIIMFVANGNALGNMKWFDTTYSFERVQIAMPDGSYVSGNCENWQDYDSSDVVQVKVDGKVYLTHYMNVVLISD